MRQYIGARYTPVIFNNNGSSVWLPNRVYEPLTIVTYNNGAYTSAKTVPANVGNPAANPEYWVNTGNYNGFMGEIDKEIREINESIEDLNLYKPIIESNNQWISSTWEAPVFRKLNCLIIGDSYTVGEHPTAQTKSWAYQFRDTVNSFGGQVTINAQGGSGFIGLNNVSFTDLLKSAPKKNYNLIVVQGCGNHPANTTQTDVDNAIAKFISQCKTLYPGVKLFVFSVTKNVSTTPKTNYEPWYSSYMLTHGIPYVNGRWWIPIKSMISSDMVHPTQEGQNNLFNNFLSFITQQTVKHNLYLENDYAVNTIFVNGVTPMLLLRNIDFSRATEVTGTEVTFPIDNDWFNYYNKSSEFSWVIGNRNARGLLTLSYTDFLWHYSGTTIPTFNQIYKNIVLPTYPGVFT